MIFNLRWLAGGHPALLCGLLFLSACAPAVTGPSAAMREKFATLLSQQQEQAEQLKNIQQQLTLLQQQLDDGAPLTAPAPTTPPATLTIPAQLPATLPRFQPATPALPGSANTEISDLAGSAATYLAAFSNLAAGDFAPAEAGFSRFLSDYPQHQYAANARYWLASAQAGQHKLQAAMANLQQLITADNAQHKTPAAMLLLAQLYRQQDWNNEADDILEQLRSRYPDSPEAQHFYQSAKPQ